MNFLWASLNDLSFLTLLSLVSLTVPGLAHSLQQVILKFLYLDVLMTDQWLNVWIEEFRIVEIERKAKEKAFNIDEISNETPFNSFFQDSGFDTMSILNNLGSTLVYIAILVFVYLLYILLSVLCFIFPNYFKNPKEWLGRKIKWNLMIAFLL